MDQGCICLDIDGTVTADPYTVPENVAIFLRELVEAGWSIAFITGRNFTFTCNTLQSMDFPYYLAVHNGADLFAMPECRLLCQEYLTGDPIAILDDLHDAIGEDFLVYSGYAKGDFCYYRTNRFSPKILRHLELIKPLSATAWQELGDFSALGKMAFPLIKSLGSKEQMGDLHTRLSEIRELEASVIKDPLAQDIYLNLITARQAKKGMVIKKLREFFPEETLFIAAGDDNNDRSLLQESDIAIVMETASESLLQEADIVAKSAKQEGIIEALKQAIRLGLDRRGYRPLPPLH